MGFQGKLAESNIMQVLNAINLANHSGGLTISRQAKHHAQNGKIGQDDTEQARLGFQVGELRAAHIDNHPMDLLSILQNRGKITVAQAANLRQRRDQYRSDKGLALLLMNTYHVSRDDIVDGVRQYMIDIVNYVMTWREGEFHFDENDTVMNEAIIPVSFRLDSLITNWRNVAQELNTLVLRVKDLEMRVDLTPDYRDRLKAISLSRQQWKFVATATKGRKTLQQIAEENQLSAVEIRRTAVQLEDSGVITLDAPPPTPPPKKGITGRLRETGLFRTVKPE